MKRVGVLGGGQLARMLALAGLPLDLRLRAWDPAADPPAAPVAEHVQGDWGDPAALERFLRGLDVATLELEGVPVATAEAVAARVPLHPSVRALASTRDRLDEKRLALAHGIPVEQPARWKDGTAVAALRALCDHTSFRELLASDPSLGDALRDVKVTVPAAAPTSNRGPAPGKRARAPDHDGQPAPAKERAEQNSQSRLPRAFGDFVLPAPRA